MAYGLLPNKKETTYKKFFKMLKKIVPNAPETFNMDFEKAANNAARKIFKCFIHLCFFHFSQSGWRRVQINGLVKAWYEDDFRLSFKKIQALAFLPVHDVVEGFEIISRGKNYYKYCNFRFLKKN
jgi:hypothetical protein